MMQQNPTLQRRRYFRVRYPTVAKPRVLGKDYDIIELSEEGMIFNYTGSIEASLELAEIGRPIYATIRFHNGEQLDIAGKIIRCYSCIETHRTFFTCYLEKGVSYERIYKEQIYILNNFPGFRVA